MAGFLNNLIMQVICRARRCGYCYVARHYVGFVCDSLWQCAVWTRTCAARLRNCLNGSECVGRAGSRSLPNYATMTSYQSPYQHSAKSAASASSRGLLIPRERGRSSSYALAAGPSQFSPTNRVIQVGRTCPSSAVDTRLLNAGESDW